jgi:hypothetical protein
MKAYPYSHKHPTTGLTASSEGMDLRDHFAGEALHAQISMPEVYIAIRGKMLTVEDVCVSCYEWADAMLKARSKKDE